MGEFEILGAPPGSEVAVRANLHEDEWILGRVLQFRPDIGYYDIADVDDADKNYALPESQVIVLDNQQVKIIKGDEVLAVYPDTTSFYPAIVTQAAKKSTSG